MGEALLAFFPFTLTPGTQGLECRLQILIADRGYSFLKNFPVFPEIDTFRDFLRITVAV